MHSTQFRHRWLEIFIYFPWGAPNTNLESLNLYSQLIGSFVAFAVFISFCSFLFREQQKQTFFFFSFLLHIKANFCELADDDTQSQDRRWASRSKSPPFQTSVPSNGWGQNIWMCAQKKWCENIINKHQHCCKSGAHYSFMRMSVTMTLFSFNFRVHSCALFITQRVLGAIARCDTEKPFHCRHFCLQWKIPNCVTSSSAHSSLRMSLDVKRFWESSFLFYF